MGLRARARMLWWTGIEQQLLLEEAVQVANKPALGKGEKVTFEFNNNFLLSATRPIDHQRVRGKRDEDLRREICRTPISSQSTCSTPDKIRLLLGSPTAQNSH